MSEERRQNNASILQKANHFGMALFVFIVLAGTILWLTGSLHFGPRNPVETNGAIDDGHGHEHESQTNELICREHGFPESLCVLCNPSLAATCKAKGDWCTEHNLPESQCTFCNPGLMKSSTADAGWMTDLRALEEAMCEHGLRTIDCDNCRYEIGVVKVQPSVADALIETTVVKNTPRTTTLTLTGQVQLDKTRVVDVVSIGSGQVKRVEKLLGQEVTKGDTLAVIHSADLGQAKARFLEVQARLELATSTFEREKELHEKKISSEADYLSALSELKAAQAYYAAAERRLRLFGLGTEQINATKNEKENGPFAELVLRAPQSGTIIAQNVSAGALVDTTQSMYTIADLSNVWIWYDLYEKDLAVLHDQLSSGRIVLAKVRVKAFQAEVFDGVVDLIGSQVDEHTRTVKLRVQVKNEERKLKPGMFAEAEITVSLKDNITVVPSSAILSDEGETFVFQHWKEDLWVRRDVPVGRNQGGFVEVLNGIPKGTIVVSRGAFMLKSDILREKMGAGCAD
ncbi:MAG: efflux RND transporter periplasmic adaptor subunit [Planctomycetota bacterium]|jgi:cobalt-zinc-cadmium efflux system membrane fusion protein